MKKLLMGLIAIIIIIVAYFMLFGKSSVNTEEKIDNALAKSIEETKNEKKKIEDLMTVIAQEINDRGYADVGLSFSFEENILTVQVKDKRFIEINKERIRSIIMDSAKKIEFQDFEINILAMDSYVTLSEEDKKLNDSIMEVSEVVSELLKNTGYLSSFSITTHPNNEIIIEIHDTKEKIEKQDEFEKHIADTIFSKTNMKFAVKLRKKSKSDIRDQEWQPIFDTITEETNKKFEEYRGFAYSFHPEPLQIIIKTNIETPKWFGNSRKKINQMEKYVDNIIELKREELSIEEIPYEIIIRDKNNKNID